MSRPAPLGAISPARSGHNLRGQEHPTPTCQQESGVPEIEQAVALGIKRRRAKQIYDFFQAQAVAEADFMEYVLDYADPTGEAAVDEVLADIAKEIAA